jgi:hypothetical protein
MTALLTPALGSCAARLTTLRLSLRGRHAPWDASAALGALSHLRSLFLEASARLSFASPLAALTALESFELRSKHMPCASHHYPPIELCNALPPTLTRLDLHMCGYQAMLPIQVTMHAASEHLQGGMLPAVLV